MANLKHANVVQRSVHQMEVEAHRAKIEGLLQEHTAQLEAKDYFCAAKKVSTLAKL